MTGITILGSLFELITLAHAASACPGCRAQVGAIIGQSDVGGNVLLMALPVLVMALLGLGTYHAHILRDMVAKGLGR